MQGGAVLGGPGPVAAAMGTMDDEDLLAYFCMEYRWNILHLRRKLQPEEEDSLSVFIRLQEKRKAAKLMGEALEAKEEFKERVKAVECCWRDLHAQEAELKTHTEESLRIAKEYDKMRVQALKKAARKREKKVQKEFELLRAKRELEVWRNKHEKLYNKVQKYSIFKGYLEDVVKSSQFVDIQEVISPYETLLRVLRDLEQLQERHKEKSEQARVFLDQYIAEKEAEILQYKHELVELQQCFDQAKEDIQFWGAQSNSLLDTAGSGSWVPSGTAGKQPVWKASSRMCCSQVPASPAGQETRWADIQETSPKKALELDTIRMAILNLFQSANRQMNAKLNVPVEVSHRQLNRIQQRIQDLADISTEGKEDIQNRQ
ncbi:coiled-coil domain-containing protein 42 [Pezoporus flaviventris]|uniref:coiled-coil domain-containing protein 42 n=1 Tax=Pezoporus flaviventris TaxID=889875 RepID=UPI002AB0BC8B|nr:coiled-coil domain-containing protein 42 [Pezoporus flaviventris]